MVLRDGAPVFDRLGRWFTLVCVGFAPGDALPAAAARRGLPLAVLRLDDPEVAKVYGRGLLLVRPDQHIAWRGPACDDSRAADGAERVSENRATPIGFARHSPALAQQWRRAGTCQPTLLEPSYTA